MTGPENLWKCMPSALSYLLLPAPLGSIWLWWWWCCRKRSQKWLARYTILRRVDLCRPNLSPHSHTHTPSSDRGLPKGSSSAASSRYRAANPTASVKISFKTTSATGTGMRLLDASVAEGVRALSFFSVELNWIRNATCRIQNKRCYDEGKYIAVKWVKYLSKNILS